MIRCVLALLALSLAALSANATIDPAQAQSIFQQAQSICDRDAGALWGHTLCGPMLLVDPEDRDATANQVDAGGVLKQVGTLFVGTLPRSVIISDTTITWSGTRWCELMWPWPMREDPDMRHVTLAHELFHRIEAADLHIQTGEGDNRHLDTLEGRYLMEMEWRALASALQAATPAARKRAIQDAILFRRQRYVDFTSAPGAELALEANEGIAEYTGVRIGLGTTDARIRYGLRDLTSYADAPSLVRSFAYATGPAWGLLLDQAAPKWRLDYLQDPLAERFDQRLGRALHLPEPNLAQLSARTAVYDPGNILRAHEVARDQSKRAQATEYQAKLVDGPVLIFPLSHPEYQFKPQTLVALEHVGTVYPTMTLKDEWGTLIVDGGGVLMHDEPKIATASAVDFDRDALRAPGFKAVLNSGWTVVAGRRPGDYEIQRAPNP
jgi:hypothetical protein